MISTNRKRTAGRARALLMVFMIALTIAGSFAFRTESFAYAAGTTERVATFGQLKAALEKGSVSEIVIDPQAAEDLTNNFNDADEKEEVTFTGSDVFYIPIEYPLVVSRDITIRSEVPVNFARSGAGGDGKAFKGQNQVTPALFNVDAGKTLTIEEDIMMTGEEVSYTFDEGQAYIEEENGEGQDYVAPNFDFSIKTKDGTGETKEEEEDNAVWEYGADPGAVTKGGYFIHTKGGNVVLGKGVALTGLYTSDKVTDVAPIYIDGSAKPASIVINGAEIINNDLGRDAADNGEVVSAGAVKLNGAKATADLSSGEISGNRADTDGVYVSEGSELSTDEKFIIDENEIYYEKNEGEPAKDEKPSSDDAVECREGTYTVETKDGTVITLNGLLPVNASVEAYPVDVEIDNEDVICAYDIYIYTEDGRVFEPENGDTVSVSFTVPSFEEEKDSNYSVYYVPDKGEPEKISDAVVEEDTITFDAEHLSVYAWTATGNLDKVYLDGTNGNDNNNGSSANRSVKTIEKALSLVKQNGTIYITGTVTVANDQTWTSVKDGNDGKVTIQRYANLKNQPLITVNGGGNLTLENITIDGGSGAASGEVTSTYYPYGSASAPLIYVKNEGKLNLNSGSILQNNANKASSSGSDTLNGYDGQGGAVYCAGTLVLDNGTIKGCQARSGGGIYLEGSNSSNRATMTMYSGLIDGNYSRDDYSGSSTKQHKNAGGGIYIGKYVDMTMYSGTISNNKASKEGGGISMNWLNEHKGSYSSVEWSNDYYSTFTMHGGTFDGNYSRGMGGGLNIGAAMIATVSGGEFIKNRADGINPQYSTTEHVFSGGGIYVGAAQMYGYDGYAGKAGKLIIHRLVVTQNRAYDGGGYAGCPTGNSKVLELYGKNDGTAIYNNTASRYSYSNSPTNEMAQSKGAEISLDMPNTALGGGSYDWRYKGRDSGNNFNAWDNNLSDYSETIRDIYDNKLYTTMIRDNYGYYGGGIGNNGEIQMGLDDNKTFVAAVKTWKNDNSDVRPRYITLQLMRSVDRGPYQAYGSPVVVRPTSSDRLKDTWPVYYFDDLPAESGVNNGNHKYTYTVKETSVPGYYTATTATSNNGETVTITNTYNPPEAKIYKVSGKVGSNGVTVIDSTKPLSGAEFKLYKIISTDDNYWYRGAQQIGSNLKSNADGSITLPNEVSTSGGDVDWWLEEVKAAPGYAKNPNPWIIWTRNGTIKEIYRIKNYTSGETKASRSSADYERVYSGNGTAYIHNEKINIELFKTDENGNTITNNKAKFALYVANKDASVFNNDGTLKTADFRPKLSQDALAKAQENLETGNDGKLSINNIEANTVYLLFETKAPSGFERNRCPWVIYVKEDGTYNMYEYTADTYKDNISITSEADSTWEKEKANIINPGRWWPHTGYSILTGDNAGKLKNKLNDVAFDKIDRASGDRLEKVQFELYHAIEGPSSKYAGRLVYKVDTDKGYGGKVYDNSPITIGTDGKYHMKGLKPGLYLLFETKTEDNSYVSAVAPWGFEIKSDGTVGRTAVIKDEFIADWEKTNANKPLTGRELECSEVEALGEYKLVNDKTEIELYKVEGTSSNGGVHIDTQNTKYLEGAVFNLYATEKVSNGQNWKKTVKVAEGLTSDENGKIVLPRIISNIGKNNRTITIDNETYTIADENGDVNYWLEEVKPAAGYVKSDIPWIIWVKDGTLKEIYYFKENLPAAEDQITKSNENLIYVLSHTNANRTGYIHNEPIKLNKVSETGSPLAGAEFIINNIGRDSGKYALYSSINGVWKDESGKEILLTSDNNGEIDISAVVSKGFREKGQNAEEIEFFLYEQKPPTGYKKAKAPWMVKVTRAGEVTVYQYDDRYADPVLTDGPNTCWNPNRFTPVEASADDIINKNDLINDRLPLELGKKSSIDGQMLDGVEFKLFKASVSGDTYTKESDTAIAELTSHDGGKIVMNDAGIPASGEHKYLLFETKAKQGYIKPDAPWIIVVKDGKIDELYALDEENAATAYSDTSTSWSLNDYKLLEGQQIDNDEVYVLPSAGGMGTYWFMVIGMGMMTFAVTTLITRKFSKKKL